jgi:hypothetical protein
MNLRKELEELQIELVKDFKKQLQNGDASSTDKSNMIKLFKDNGIFLKEEVGENPFENIIELEMFKEIELDKNKKIDIDDEIDLILDAELT